MLLVGFLSHKFTQGYTISKLTRIRYNQIIRDLSGDLDEDDAIKDALHVHIKPLVDRDEIRSAHTIDRFLLNEICVAKRRAAERESLITFLYQLGTECKRQKAAMELKWLKAKGKLDQADREIAECDKAKLANEISVTLEPLQIIMSVSVVVPKHLNTKKK
ncbi:hypothetical protein HDE_06496 [Halotydeus destructor]|nr:hypothetical protein HDE_06496 [Halotydeus destructor]